MNVSKAGGEIDAGNGVRVRFFDDALKISFVVKISKHFLEEKITFFQLPAVIAAFIIGHYSTFSPHSHTLKFCCLILSCLVFVTLIYLRLNFLALHITKTKKPHVLETAEALYCLPLLLSIKQKCCDQFLNLWLHTTGNRTRVCQSTF